jgi:hypothetical protein
MSGDERDQIFSQALDPSRCFLCGEMVGEALKSTSFLPGCSPTSAISAKFQWSRPPFSTTWVSVALLS